MEQADLLKLVASTLERLKIPYAVVGSFASGVWGESRFTQDIDILVDLRGIQAELLCDAFPEEEFYVSREAARDAVARRGQFNIIHPSSGNKVDFMIAGTTPWDISQLRRRRSLPVFSGQEVMFAAPEDVILSKLNYYRIGHSEKHLRDISGILKVSGNVVDRDYIAKFAAQFDVHDIWQALLSESTAARRQANDA